MNIIEFIGFMIIMVASVFLSLKKGPNKSVAAESMDDILESIDAEQEKKPEKVVVRTKSIPKPKPKPAENEKAFIMHQGAFEIKKENISEGRDILENLDSLKQAIMIQEIFNKPKGLQF